MFGEVFDTTKSFTSHFTTHDDVQAVIDFPFQAAAENFAARSTAASDLRDFFAGDDWYTDADSNVYQLPTFLGNHDMGRFGFFVTRANSGATDSELVARDRLAHELMYLSRGNPVVYYGDEQGFTGSGGDQVARQTMFASVTPAYLDDDLLGTDRTHAVDNFNTAHPLYRAIGDLARLTQRHHALRDGAQIHRFGSSSVYAFSRLDRGHPHEYVVALEQLREHADRRRADLHVARLVRPVYGAKRLAEVGLGRPAQPDRAGAVGRGLPRRGSRAAQQEARPTSRCGCRHRVATASRSPLTSTASRSTRSRSSRAASTAGARSAPTTTRPTACSTTSPTRSRGRGSSTRPSSSTTPATSARAATGR